MSKIAPLARKPTASLTTANNFLVAEYSWLIPDIENKLERFDYSGRKVKSFASHKFYTGPQGKEGKKKQKCQKVNEKKGQKKCHLSFTGQIFIYAF